MSPQKPKERVIPDPLPVPTTEEESEALWDLLFEATADELQILADEALEDYRAGRTVLMDPDKPGLGVFNKAEDDEIPPQ